MRLREWLELRSLAADRYEAHAGEQYKLRRLADTYGLDASLHERRVAVKIGEDGASGGCIGGIAAAPGSRGSRPSPHAADRCPR